MTSCLRQWPGPVQVGASERRAVLSEEAEGEGLQDLDLGPGVLCLVSRRKSRDQVFPAGGRVVEEAQYCQQLVSPADRPGISRTAALLPWRPGQLQRGPGTGPGRVPVGAVEAGVGVGLQRPG